MALSGYVKTFPLGDNLSGHVIFWCSKSITDHPEEESAAKSLEEDYNRFPGKLNI